MSKKYLILTMALLLLIGILSSCGEKTNNEPSSDMQKPNNESPSNPQKPNGDPMLQGTKWKLEGVVDAKTGTLTVFEPKDCDRCYELVFNTDTTFTTHSSANDLSGIYTVDYAENAIHFSDLFGTKLGERGDGIIYVNILHDVHSFFCKENELKLYYNENKNYLLFKLLK